MVDMSSGFVPCSATARTSALESMDLSVEPVFVLPVVSASTRRVIRLIDFVFAVVMLVVLAIPMVVIALLVKITSPGPVMFKQERVGQHGRKFQVLKFRTMADGTHDQVLADPELRRIYTLNDFKLPGDDPRITKVGSFLRRTSLDELPQFVNVLKGQMGLVGVRPIEFDQLAMRSEYDQDLYRLHRPALTGLWQVAGRSTFRDTHRVELDRLCLEQWALWPNLWILLRTPKAVLIGAGAH